MSRRTRREFLGTASAAALAGLVSARDRETRLILLGTSGGPRPKVDRAATSQVIVIGGALHVVDCGDGVARRLVAAGLALPELRRIFITHHHSDHNADYGNLLLLSWAAGLRTPVDAYGPPPLERMTQLVFELHAFDIQVRTADEGRVPLRPLVTAHEIDRAGPVVEDERVKVTAALVHHPPVVPALAYRFDTDDRSIVISGDTAYSESLLELARGADVLVHEALHAEGIERTVAKAPNATRLLEHILASHTTARDAGRLAAEAGVKTLVLSHLVPVDDPLVGHEDFRREAAREFDGEIVVANDLMEI